MTAPAPSPRPQPGEVWDVSDALFHVLAAGPVRVLEVDGDRVTFTDNGGALGTFTVGTFRGLYQPAAS